MNFFSRDKRTPYEKARDQTREISSTIRKEKRQLERQINQTDREIQRLTNDIKKHALNNNKDALRTLAKAIVKIKHDKSHLYSAIANLDTIDNAVKSQLINVRITGVMQKSSEIAQSLSQLMKVEQFQAVSQEFSQELMKMGIVGEMIEETVSAALDNEDHEDEVDEEVNKVLEEIIGQPLRQLPSVVVPGVVPVVAEPVEDDLDKRLHALREGN